MSLVDELNTSYKYVCEHSKSVRINYNKIDEMIEQINKSKVDYWLDSNPYNLMDKYIGGYYEFKKIIFIKKIIITK